MASRQVRRIAPRSDQQPVKQESDEVLARRLPPPGWRSRVVARSLEKATQRSLERGGAFLGAARSLLISTEATGFTVQQVADVAGQSLRSFYQHFTGKDDLLLALFEEDMAEYAEDLRSRAAGLDDPIDRLMSFVTAGVEVERNGYAVGMSKYRIALATSHPDEVALAQAPVVALARDLIADAIKAGAVPPCDPDATAYMLVTLKTAYNHSNLLGNELGTRLPSPAELARFCVLGLGATDSRRGRRPGAAESA
jgi:AcrR family transcriptional regulator